MSGNEKIPCFVLNDADYLEVNWDSYGFSKSIQHEARVLFVGIDHVDNVSLLPSLELIATRTTNCENIQVDCPVVFLSREDVADILSTAEFTMYLILCLLRRSRLGYDLRGKTLGIFGYGRIGKAVEHLAIAFGMTIVIYNRYTKNKKEILEQSDIISLHLPAHPEFVDFISYDEFLWIKDSAYIVNTARPYMLNTDATTHALLTGQVAGVAVDYIVDSLGDLSETCNFIQTPHLGGSTRDAVVCAANKIVGRARDYMRRGNNESSC